MGYFDLREAWEFVWAVLTTGVTLMTGIFGLIVGISERVWRKATSWAAYFSVLAVAIFVSCYMNWEDEKVKLTAYQYAHPTIMMSNSAEIEKISAGRNPYWNINILIKTERGIVHNAVPYFTLICLIESDRCSDNYMYNNRIQTYLRKGVKSFDAITLDKEGEKIVAFFINTEAKGKTLKAAFMPGIDSNCIWCANMKIGKYRVSLVVSGEESQSKADYILEWYGDVDRISLTKENN